MYLTMCWNFLMGIDSGKGKGGGGGGPIVGRKGGFQKLILETVYLLNKLNNYIYLNPNHNPPLGICK